MALAGLAGAYDTLKSSGPSSPLTGYVMVLPGSPASVEEAWVRLRSPGRVGGVVEGRWSGGGEVQWLGRLFGMTMWLFEWLCCPAKLPSGPLRAYKLSISLQALEAIDSFSL